MPGSRRPGPALFARPIPLDHQHAATMPNDRPGMLLTEENQRQGHLSVSTPPEPAGPISEPDQARSAVQKAECRAALLGLKAVG